MIQHPRQTLEAMKTGYEVIAMAGDYEVARSFMSKFENEVRPIKPK